MAMGIVSDSDFDSEAKKILPKHDTTIPTPTKIPTTTIERIERGRPRGSVEVPNGLRKIIGEESITNGRQSAVELAQSFGISPSSASAYSTGATSTASYDERPNIEHINGTKERITKKARGKLMQALRHITTDKLESAKARDLASVAKDMSAVIKNMEPDSKSNQSVNSGPTFVFYSPQFKKEESFDVVVAKD